MKDDWSFSTIGEACQVVNGGTPKTGEASYWGGPHQWITPAEMGRLSSPYVDRTRRSLTERALESSSATLIPPHSVILSTRAPIGHLVINTVPMATNQGCRGIVPGKSVHYKFLFYYLYSITDLLNDLGTGATFRELSGSNLKKVPLPVPPLPDQQRIVAKLDEAFVAIAKAKENAEKNVANARAIFESELNVVFKKKGEGWTNKKVGHLGSVQTGSTPKTSEPDNYGCDIPFIKPSDFNSDGTLDYMHDGLSHKGLAQSRRVGAGSVLMVCIGATIGKAGFSDREITTNQQINALTPTCDFSPKFIYYQMITDDFQRQVISSSGQATLPIINKSKWKSLDVKVPENIDEQNAIVKRLDGIQAETRKLQSVYQSKIAELDALKQSLLNHAFTGQL